MYLILLFFYTGGQYHHNIARVERGNIPVDMMMVMINGEKVLLKNF